MWRNRKVIGIWVQQYNVRAYVMFEGLAGWWKLTNPDDDVTTAMLQLCIHAKAANRVLYFWAVGTEIREIYVF